jgi:CelD/BcsL family acetyltransferase involved in cellulose biosynthesis
MIATQAGELDGLARRWDALAETTAAPPFLRSGWTRAWWEAFGTGRLCILTETADEELRGIVPLQWMRRSLMPLANYHTPLFGFLSLDATSAARLGRKIIELAPTRLSLMAVAPNDPGAESCREAAVAAGYAVEAKRSPAAPYVELNGSWEDYCSTLRRKLLTELRRRRRRLEEQGEIRLEVWDGTERLGRLLEEGFRVEDSGWKGEHGSSILSRPSTRSFYIRIAEWAAAEGWLRLAFLRLDSTPLAFDFCFEHAGTHYLLKTGYDPSFSRYAPGMVMRYLMLERAFAVGLHTYDFLGEDYGWKREWTQLYQERLTLDMFSPSLRGRARRVKQAMVVAAETGTRRALRASLGDRGVNALKRMRAASRSLAKR